MPLKQSRKMNKMIGLFRNTYPESISLLPTETFRCRLELRFSLLCLVGTLLTGPFMAAPGLVPRDNGGGGGGG